MTKFNTYFIFVLRQSKDIIHHHENNPDLKSFEILFPFKGDFDYFPNLILSVSLSLSFP